MKNSELIKKLQQFDGDLEVTTSDLKGTFSDIVSLTKQSWECEDGKHESLTICLGGYDKRKTLVDEGQVKNWNVKIVFDNEDDEKFIDDVNSELGDDEQIDKKDARKANTAFKIDFAEMQKKYKNWFDEKYDEIVRESMIELFGDDTPLNNKTIKDLKLHIYENGWQNELKKEELNIRSEILGLLYHKLEEKVSEKLSIDANKLWNEVCDCGCRKNRSYKCNDDTCCFDKWPDDDFLSDFAKKIKAIDKISRIFF